MPAGVSLVFDIFHDVAVCDSLFIHDINFHKSQLHYWKLLLVRNKCVVYLRDYGTKPEVSDLAGFIRDEIGLIEKQRQIEVCNNLFNKAFLTLKLM